MSTTKQTTKALSREEIASELKKINENYQIGEGGWINLVAPRRISKDITILTTYHLAKLGANETPIPLMCYEPDDCTQVLYAEELRGVLIRIGASPQIPQGSEFATNARPIRDYAITLIEAARAIEEANERKR